MTNTFLGCDWGSTRFRLRWVSLPGGEVHGEVVSADGAGAIAASTPAELRAARYETVLASQLERLLAAHPGIPPGCPLVVSGMAGSSIGWREVPYATLPFRLSGADVRTVEPAVTDHRLGSRRIVLMSGVAGDWDMMRGEETEILGLAHWAGPGWSHGGATVVLPGTHSKHVTVADGAIRSIHTHFTGELFAVLSQHSLLRHSLPSEATGSWDPAGPAFREGLDHGARRPLSEAIFHVRTRQVLRGGLPADNAGFLSGVLIGAELATLAVPGAGPVLISAAPSLAPAYHVAAAALVEPVRPVMLVPAAACERLGAWGQMQFLAR